jgi:diadenylate cyclase
MESVDATSVFARWWEQVFAGFGMRDVLDIALVALIVTYVLLAVRNTRAFQMLRGLGLVGIAVVLARYGSMHTTTWLLQSLLLLLAIALVIILQPELRKLITTLGEQTFLRTLFPVRAVPYHEIAESARLFGESGRPVDASVSAELLATIFTTGSPLHDGAAIIRDEKIFAAACMLPLSQAKSQAQALGMRHRAALGITEATDALVVVVSEEQKKVSLAKDGQLTPPLDIDTLERMLNLHGRQRGGKS